MKETAVVMICLVLCAGFESVSETVWAREAVLGIVFLLGMWQDKVLFKRDERLLSQFAYALKHRQDLFTDSDGDKGKKGKGKRRK